jgi:fluoride exporter
VHERARRGGLTLLTRTLLVALGGLLGSVARYWLSGVVQQASGGEFPFGTLAVNILGSFVVGLIMALSLDRGVVAANTRILLTTGFCGGFTTMSTFSYETVALMRDGEMVLALSNLATTMGSCFAAVWAGQALGRVA